MQKVFLLVVLAAAAFVWLSSAGLPPVVASHFGPGGIADGFMSKGTYRVFMLAVVVAVPVLVASSAFLARVLPARLVNLPNKHYWLAPERRAASLEALASLCLRFAVALAVFLCFVHWLVVQAHAVQPPRLDETWFFVGLAAFVAATLAWVYGLFRRFRRVP